MSESSEYSRIRAERKARAEETIKANAKAAQVAKDKAQGKATAETQKAFEKGLVGKREARAANYQRATTLPTKNTDQEGE